MTTGATIQRVPVILRSRTTAGGDRKLVMSECGEYLVLDRVGKDIAVAIFDNRRSDALKAWKEDGERDSADNAGFHHVLAHALGVL